MRGSDHAGADGLFSYVSAECESAPNRTPAPKPYKALISLIEFVRGGVPIGADRDPGKAPISGVKSVQ